MIVCENLSKTFGEVKALQDVNLKIEKGKIIGLLGTNGSGKTTLLKLIIGLLEPSSGNIKINSQKVGVETKKVIAYLPENNALDLSLSVKELIQYFADFYIDFNKEKAEKLLKKLEINQKSKLKNLSKGTKEKVQLVLTISRNADFYILDEPISGVDPAARDHILDTILSNFNKDASVIMSTHLISDIERILDEVIFMNKGKIILQGEADPLREERGKSIDQIFREEFKC